MADITYHELMATAATAEETEFEFNEYSQYGLNISWYLYLGADATTDEPFFERLQQEELKVSDGIEYCKYCRAKKCINNCEEYF